MQCNTIEPRQAQYLTGKCLATVLKRKKKNDSRPSGMREWWWCTGGKKRAQKYPLRNLERKYCVGHTQHRQRIHNAFNPTYVYAMCFYCYYFGRVNDNNYNIKRRRRRRLREAIFADERSRTPMSGHGGTYLLTGEWTYLIVLGHFSTNRTPPKTDHRQQLPLDCCDQTFTGLRTDDRRRRCWTSPLTGWANGVFLRDRYAATEVNDDEDDYGPRTVDNHFICPS